MKRQFQITDYNSKDNVTLEQNSLDESRNYSAYYNLQALLTYQKQFGKHSLDVLAKSLLDGGVKIEKVSGKNAGFTIVPADGSYKVSFGEDEFVAFFKEFLRPGLVEMLF